MSEPQKLIFSRIAACIAEVEAVGKNGRNQQQGYLFRKIDDFYDAMQPVLARNKVFCAPTILEHVREQRTTTKGGFVMTTLTKVRFKIFTEDGSFVEADALGEGADSGDKSANKAAASSMKNLFQNLFAIRVRGANVDSEVDSHEYLPQPPAAPPAHFDEPEETTPPPTDPTPKATRGALMQRLMTVLAPTKEVQELTCNYMRSVPSPSGKLVLQPTQGLADIPEGVLRAIVDRWSVFMAKAEAWNQIRGAEVSKPDWRNAVIPFRPADPTKQHLSGLTLQKLFDNDPKYAFGIAMNYKAPDADATEADRAFEAACEQWRKEHGK